MFCFRCGNALPDSARFCGRCGSPVQSAAFPSDLPTGMTRRPDGSLYWLYTGKSCREPFEGILSGSTISFRYAPEKKEYTAGSAFKEFFVGTMAFAGDMILANDDNYMSDPPFMDSLEVSDKQISVSISDITKIQRTKKPDRLILSVKAGSYDIFVPEDCCGYVYNYIVSRNPSAV